MTRRSPALDAHFTPNIGLSRLNAVEVFFSATAFHSVDDLQNAIIRYIDSHKSDCRPFVWTTSAKAISKNS
jgi:hypothetical protein